METIKLDLIPGKKMPSLHASQFDDGRAYHIDLTENRVPYVLDGTETISVIIRKCDNTLVSMDIANTFANKSYLEFEVVEQMTACAGFNYGEIILEKNGDRLGSLNFYLQVEGAPDEGGITSQSEINNLKRQVHDAVVEELEDNGAEETGYDNTESGLEATNVQDAIDEVNAKVEDKADSDSVYTKIEVDTLIDNLPEPMIFKGTLGVGGTIQTLPTASASNEGFTYKVIIDGTYAGQTAKVGDVFTSNGFEWVLIPAGDEDNDTWRAIKINGVEKLGNGISSGAVDFVGSENIDVEFDSNGNKVGIKTKDIYTKEESDDKFATKTALEEVSNEVENIRIGADGTTYASAGDAVRGQVGDLQDVLINKEDSYDVRYVEPSYTSGYVNKSGVVVASSSYKYTEKIPVREGDLIIIYKDNMSYDTFEKEIAATSGYLMRFITAYNGDTAISAKGGETAFNYTVPQGVDSVVISVYTNNSKQYEQQIRVQRAITEEFSNTFNILNGKKWVACGDSFTEAGYSASDGFPFNYYVFANGRYAGKRKTYPWIIGLRNNMDIVNMAKSGMTMANVQDNSFVHGDYYKSIPLDADYITIKLGINDVNHGSQVGTIDSTDITTFYGAYNAVMDYLTANYPNAKIGLIVSNGMGNNFTFVDATIAIAKKWGVAYLDEVYDPKVPLLHRVARPEVDASVIQRKLEAFRVSASNTHPNVNAQYYEASFVENWLRSL